MPGRNITIDLNLDCADCGSSDVCADGCICPACWLPKFVFEGEREKSVWQWREFAHLLAAMNTDRIPWGWATEDTGTGVPKHSIEVLRQDDDTWYEVGLHPEGYVVSHFRRTRGIRETNTAPEIQELDELLARTVDEATNFMSPAIRKRTGNG